MPLTLTITSYHRLAPGQEVTRSIERGSISIGRGAENDWVLPDPEQVLSKKHCTIYYQDNHYFLTDTSTNGVFINQSPQRVGRGQTVELNDGDEITLGDYEMLVHIGLSGEQGKAQLPITGRYTIAFDNASQGRLLAEPSIDDLLDRSSSTPAQSPTPLIPEDADLLGGDWVKPFAGQPVSEPDHVAAEKAFFRVPEVVRGNAAQPSNDKPIPDNWHAEWQEEPAAPQSIASSAPGFDLGVASGANATGKPTPKASKPPAVSARISKQSALEAFLAGAGLPSLAIADEDALELMTNLGKIFRETVKGLLEVLTARSSIKNEFRLRQTTLRPAENNPLKFSLSLEDAMVNLLTKQGLGYLPPAQALQEAFSDIKAHQLAVMVGMLAALTQLLQRFDPKVLESRLGEPSFLDQLLPSKRKASYWKAFNALYAEIAKEAEDDFHELFGKEFARAYEQQIRKL